MPPSGAVTSLVIGYLDRDRVDAVADSMAWRLLCLEALALLHRNQIELDSVRRQNISLREEFRQLRSRAREAA